VGGHIIRIYVSLLTLASNTLKSLESAERCSKVISPNVPPIYNSGKKVFSRGEAAPNKIKCLGSTDEIKTISSHTTQGCESPAFAKELEFSFLSQLY
jgi:hypothetical protein